MPKRPTLFATLSLLALVAAAPAVAADAKTVIFPIDIPSTSLDEALTIVSRETGRDIIYPAELVAGRRSRPLAARLTADDAVRRLLQGSDLVAEMRGETIIIRGRDETSDRAADSTSGDDIIVTGTRLRGTASISTQVVGRERARAEGLTDLGEVIRSLPQNFSGGQNPGVLGVLDDSENANSSSALNLRGLGPDATLTLINGHRVAYDAAAQGVDISAIPLLAVERLELLPDGSSALYGSDAVAGVANVILRSPFDGGEARARLSVPTRGGGLQDQYSLLAGAEWARGGIIAALDYLHAEPINADQRRFTRTLDRSATILPGQTLYSGVVAGRHNLSETLTFTVDAQFSRRRSQVATPFLTADDVRSNGALVNPKVETYSVAPGLTLDLARGWQAKLTGVHGISNTRTRSASFVGGEEFVRAFASYRNRTDSAEVGAEGPLFEAPSGAARLALGAGWRGVELAGDVRNVIGGVPRTLLDIVERYDIGFAYAEGSLPIFGSGNARPGLRLLQINGAVRYEHYSSIGGVTVPKLSLRWDPVEPLSLRASWGRSFKAPTLLQKGQLTRGIILPAAIFRPAPTVGSTVILLTGGNSQLDPERARTWTAGAVLTPFADRDVRLEAVYYNIRYRDRVAAPVIRVTTVFGEPIFSDLISVPTVDEINALDNSLSLGLINQTGAPFDPSSVAAIVDNRLANIAQFRVEGVDVSINAKTRRGNSGQFSFDGTLSYIKSDQQFNAGQARIERAGTIFDPPHWRARASLGWQKEEFQATGVISHIGGTRDDRFSPARRVGAFTSVDLNASWSPATRTGLLANTEFLVSVLNLFEEEPGVIAVDDPSLPPFDSANYPANGRVVSLTLVKRW